MHYRKKFGVSKDSLQKLLPFFVKIVIFLTGAIFSEVMRDFVGSDEPTYSSHQFNSHLAFNERPLVEPPSPVLFRGINNCNGTICQYYPQNKTLWSPQAWALFRGHLRSYRRESRNHEAYFRKIGVPVFMTMHTWTQIDHSSPTWHRDRTPIVDWVVDPLKSPAHDVLSDIKPWYAEQMLIEIEDYNYVTTVSKALPRAQDHPVKTYIVPWGAANHPSPDIVLSLYYTYCRALKLAEYASQQLRGTEIADNEVIMMFRPDRALCNHQYNLTEIIDEIHQSPDIVFTDGWHSFAHIDDRHHITSYKVVKRMCQYDILDYMIQSNGTFGLPEMTLWTFTVEKQGLRWKSVRNGYCEMFRYNCQDDYPGGYCPHEQPPDGKPQQFMERGTFLGGGDSKPVSDPTKPA